MTVTASASNSGGNTDTSATANFVVAAKVYAYERVSIVVSGEVFPDTGNGTLAVGYPQILVGTTRILPVNKTGVQVGGCMPSSMKLSNGLPAMRCHEPQNGNILSVFPLDPVKQELLPAYTGQLPAGIEFYPASYGDFNDTPNVAYGVVLKGSYIDVPGVGTYYWTNTDSFELRLTRDGFKTHEVVQTGQTFKVLTTYTNPN